jgi:hypothetical protein
MFILKRQDVEISSIPHPTKEQNIPILHYQGQTFRLISVFSAAQEDDARAFWRDLTDNRGKACVLLEEPERYSVWGKVRLDQGGAAAQADSELDDFYIQAGLLLMQSVYFEVEDLLGTKQAKAFENELTQMFIQWRFPDIGSPSDVSRLLDDDPIEANTFPAWQEHHLNTLMQELYRLGKSYFGNDTFTERVLETLQDLPGNGRDQFLQWLAQSPTGKLWK